MPLGSTYIWKEYENSIKQDYVYFVMSFTQQKRFLFGLLFFFSESHFLYIYLFTFFFLS